MSPARLAAVLLLASAAAARAATWQELGPAPITSGVYSGRISAVACSATDPGLYFVAGADGGVWRTVDAGITWTPLTDHMPTTAIGALAIDPTDEQVVYAGSGEANFANHSRYGLGVYKSTDGGATWAQLGAATFAGRSVSRLIVHPLQPQVVFAAVVRAGGFPAMGAAKRHPLAGDPVGVYRSTDGGTSWTRLSAGLPDLCATDLAMEPGNPAVLHAAIGRIFGDPANGIYKSTDGGDTWTRLTGGGWPTAEAGRISLAVAPSRPQRLYALVAEPASATGGGSSTLGAYRSDDAGANWTALPLGNIQATYGWYNSVVSVSPSNADVVIMGGLDMRRSRNAGASWQTITPPHVDNHAAAWDASGRLVVGDDGGVHRSTNVGDDWIHLNDGLGTVQFYAGVSTHPLLSDRLLGGTQDNGSLDRRAPGRDWNQVYGGDGGWTQIDQAQPWRSFVEYQGTGNLFVSTDDGANYNFSGRGINGGDRNCFLPPHLIRPGDSTRMLYGTHRVWRSTDSGANWGSPSADLTGGTGSIRTLAQSLSDPDVVYAATSDGRLQRSDDGGVNFTLVDSGLSGWTRTTREIRVHPADPMVVYHAGASFGVDQVRRSDDGGANWTSLDGDLPDVPVNTIAVDVRPGGPIVYAGADDGVWWAREDTLEWRRLGDGLPHVAVIDLILEPSRGRLIAATQGRGAWSIAPIDPADRDGDGVPDAGDDCPDDPDPLQQDGDGDGVGDACDVCPAVADPAQVDSDGDGFGAACDCDDADDGVNPGVPEDCANLADDDCDGLPDPWDPDCGGVDLLSNDSIPRVDGATFALMRGILRPGGPPAMDPVADLAVPDVVLPLELIDEAPDAAAPPHRGVFVFYELHAADVVIRLERVDADSDGGRDDLRITQ